MMPDARSVQSYLAGGTPVTVQLVHPKLRNFFTQAHLSQLKPAMLGYSYSGKGPFFKDSTDLVQSATDLISGQPNPI